MSGDLTWKLPERGAHGTVILLSGTRRVGKTTLLLAVREAALRAGLTVGGILSVARFAGSEKTGIDLMDAASGAVSVLATMGGDGAISTGQYVFDPQVMATGLRYARAGQGADVFFVDELGPLELKKGQGWTSIIDMVRARDFGVALITMRPELIDLARERFSLSPDSPLVVVDEASRDQLARYVCEWLTDTS